MPSAAGLYYFAHEAQNYSRPPVILIHGAGGSHLSWPAQVRRIPGQRIFAVDLPGHGKSGGIGHHLVNDYADHILDFMKALGLRAAVLVGHSLGSAIALYMVIRYPNQTLGLGLVGGGAKLRVATQLLHSASNPSTFPTAIQMIIDDSFAPLTGKRLKELVAQRMAETRSTVLYGDLMACESFDETKNLADISTPTLIVCGEEDKMTPPKFSEYLKENIDGAQLNILHNAGHMVMLEQPDLMADRLDDFLNRIPYQRGQ